MESKSHISNLFMFLFEFIRMSKRVLQDTTSMGQQHQKLRIDDKARTLKRLMSANIVTTSNVEKILCEGCHKRALPAEPDFSGNLTGECRFCSRRSLCIDCWSLCKICRLELCSLCSVKDYSQQDTLTVCLDCYRHRKTK